MAPVNVRNCLLVNGSARHLPLADNSVHCVVTSIPYWGLRAYGTNPQVWGDGWRGELGLEPTPDLFVEHIVEVFREVRRVMHPSGTLWLNIGDSYATAPNGRSAAATKANGGDDRTFRDKPINTVNRGFNYQRSANSNDARSVKDPSNGCGLKPKDLVMMPARVAIALQADGWYLRSDCIWSKVNPLPSSVKDRPATSHEYVFLLTKKANYFYDWVGVRQSAKYGIRIHDASTIQKYDDSDHIRPGGGVQPLYRKKTKGADPASGRNLRTVWTLPTQPLSGKRYGVDVEHFAAFPEKLVEPCIRAGSSAHGVCVKCKAQWERVLRPTEEYAENFGSNNGADHDRLGRGYHKRTGSGPPVCADYLTLGWTPTCKCGCEEVEPAVCFDPFAGSGTVGVVALREGRSFVGVDLSGDYLKLARARIAFSREAKTRHRPKITAADVGQQLSLFG